MIRPSLQSKVPTHKRATVRLSATLDKNLLAYTAAASAGLLMSALPSEAKIVYTSSNIPIVQNGGLIPLDLNHDGIPDFEFSNFSYQSHGIGDLFLAVAPAQSSNEIWGAQSLGKLCAAALPARKPVGHRGRFQQDPPKGLYMAHIGLGGSTGTNTLFGPWLKVETAYVGLKFVIQGKIHFGWARVKFNSVGDFGTASIAGYAYETVPNRPIITGKKKGAAKSLSNEADASVRDAPTPAVASLGLLAKGTTGLAVWRSK